MPGSDRARKTEGCDTPITSKNQEQFSIGSEEAIT
jgi:hypothetical protein